MPVSSDIYSLIQQPKLVAPQVNPLEQLGQALQLQSAQYGIRKAQREDADTNALNEVYAQAIGADGKTDRNKLVQLAAQRNLGSKLPGIQKQFSDADMADAKLQETKLHAQKQRIEVSGQAMGALRADPSLANAHATIDLLAQHGVYSPEQAAQFKAGFERDPSIIPIFADRMFRMALSAKDQLGKTETRNTGGATQTISTDPVSGRVQVLNTVQNTATPGDVLAHGDRVASRNQAERHFKQTQEDGKTQIVQSDNGPVLVNKVTGAGKAVTGPDGQPLPGVTKPLNDSQSKALLFGTRMQEANKVLDQLASEGTNASIPGSRAPIIGGAITALSSGNQQMLDQAKRDFMTAVLRRESGASISSGEFETADKQYFPQVGDSDQVIAQKKRNRELAIQGILVEVPEKQRASITPTATAAKPTAAPSGALSAQEQQELAALRKRFGKS